jgi:hypothetical protein
MTAIPCCSGSEKRSCPGGVSRCEPRREVVIGRLPELGRKGEVRDAYPCQKHFLKAYMLSHRLLVIVIYKEPTKIESLSGILPPGAIISFAVLGHFPMVVNKLPAQYKRKFRPER